MGEQIQENASEVGRQEGRLHVNGPMVLVVFGVILLALCALLAYITLGLDPKMEKINATIDVYAVDPENWISGESGEHLINPADALEKEAQGRAIVLRVTNQDDFIWEDISFRINKTFSYKITGSVSPGQTFDVAVGEFTSITGARYTSASQVLKIIDVYARRPDVYRGEYRKDLTGK
ncbi:MAG: hypothetical protein MPJ24_07935 [Pirellulaceae bacterium]|nr:hypothetical protein [Pirellulaceae bacterium]